MRRRHFVAVEPHLASRQTSCDTMGEHKGAREAYVHAVLLGVTIATILNYRVIVYCC